MNSSRDAARGAASAFRTVLPLLVLLLVFAGCTASDSGHGMSKLPDAAGTTRFLVKISSRSDLQAAYAISDYAARGQFVVDELQRTAAATQAPVVSFLEQRHAKFESFWIANAIWVEADEETRALLAGRPEVESIEPDVPIVLDDPPAPVSAASPAPEAAALTVEVNVQRTHAPEVWALGYEGQGIVVGIIDTGFMPHPAISEKYRGYQGSPTTFKNAYNWYDTAADAPGSQCKTSPCDDNGHGTHVAGTVLGRAGNDDIGVAPGAQFIACRALKNGSGAISSLLGCYQWFMAPTDLNGRNADPALRPQIVSQSLGAGSLSVAMADAITAMDAAGILSVAAAGNTGTGCKKVGYPAGLREVLAVGALKSDSDTVSDYSSSGPAPDYPNMIKPEIVAQGDAVRSAWLNNQYRAISGTSMATPAVSGVAALVMSASPRWIGHPADVARLLRETANGNVSVGLHQSCGSGYPNMVFGYGLVDAYKAVIEATKPPARAQ